MWLNLIFDFIDISRGRRGCRLTHVKIKGTHYGTFGTQAVCGDAQSAGLKQD